MKAKLIPIMLFSVMFPLLLNSCNEQSDGNHPGQSVSSKYIVKTDGSDLKEIRNTVWGSYTFVPNSNKILHTSTTGGMNAESIGLYLINPDGSGDYPLLGNDHKINWFSSSPDNKKMLISTGDGIYILNADGEITLRKIQADLQDVRRASFSEDMTKIVFQQKYDINLMDASGSNVKTIRKANDTTSYLFPGFVFHDSLIVYLENRRSEPTLILKSYSLKSGTESYYHNISDSVPFFTFYDGKVIFSTRSEIRVIDLVYHGFDSKAIFSAGSFSISSDNKKIIYQDGLSIYSVNIDGSDKKLLYTDKSKSLNISGPSLSSDGQYLLYSGWKIE